MNKKARCKYCFMKHPIKSMSRDNPDVCKRCEHKELQRKLGDGK